MADPWSLDARVLVRPAGTFQSLVSAPRAADKRSVFWIAIRRPLFLTVVLASGISLLATSVATLRLVAPTTIYWSFVPLVEILALAIVLWRRRDAHGFPALIDTFFAGHAAWTLFLLAMGAMMSVAPPQYRWFLITRPILIGLVLVVAWSSYVDVCFFRHVCGATLRRAIRDAALYRLIAWTLMFWIFAVPEPTPFGVIQELVEAVRELLP